MGRILSTGNLFCLLLLTIPSTVSLIHYDRLLLSQLQTGFALPSSSSPSSALIGSSSGTSAIARHPQYTAYNLTVPVDHFHNESKYEPHSEDSFPLRYWFDPQFYKPGGPVIVLAAGEVSGETRLDFLERGIAHILAKETNGLPLILEHRYYGLSHPFSNLTTENLRFLSTEQALADTAYFAQHVTFPGLENRNLTAPNTPWIIYGGSYAGAFAALTRKLYPDTYWAAISSSGVTLAILDYWMYTEAQREFAPGACANNTAFVVDVVDSILLSGDRARRENLKEAFGLPELEEDGDFAGIVGSPIMGLQGTNWDVDEEDGSFAEYCAVVQAPVPVYSSNRHLQGWVEDFINRAGYKGKNTEGGLTTILLNYIGYVRNMVKKAEKGRCAGQSQLQCWDRLGKINSTEIDPAGYIRSWTYQQCTQWGYFHTGGGTPDDRMPLFSRIVDIKHAMAVCSTVFNITTPPDLNSINKYGGLDFSHHRLAFIDGAQDPWRAAGPHAIGARERESTADEPFLLIDPGVHHWDEYGPKEEDAKRQPNYPPQNIVNVQREEVKFVKAWLREFEESHQKEEDELPGEL